MNLRSGQLVVVQKQIGIPARKFSLGAFSAVNVLLREL